MHAILGFLLASCDAYLMPYSDVVVVVKDAAEREAVLGSVEEFAHHHELQAFRDSDHPAHATSPPAVKRRSERTMLYVTSTSMRDHRGFSFMVYEPSEQCMVVRFFEQSREWTPESLAALDELREGIVEIVGERLRFMVRPQEWATATGDMEEYCVRMGLPDPRKGDDI